jgi:hypothetical protein
MLTATERNSAPGCYCDVLPREDWDQCPAHGTPAQQAPNKVSVEELSAAVDEIWDLVERMYFDGRITSQQLSFFRWAARKAREPETRCGHCGASVKEL